MARFLKNRSSSDGKAPGSLVFIGRQKMDKIRISQFTYNEDHLVEKELTDVEAIPEFDDQYVNWINIDGLHDTDSIEKVRDRFDISALSMEDILNTDHRPRFIEEENHIIVIMKSFYWNEEEEAHRSEQISFILGQNYLITLQERIGDHFEPVRNRIRTKTGKISKKENDYLMYSLMDTLVDSYLTLIENIGDKIEQLEDQIINRSDEKIMNEIYRYKNELRMIRKNVWPIREVILPLSNSTSDLIHETTRAYIKDMDNLSIQVTESIDLYFNLVSDQLNLYQTNISNGVNEVMKVLTIFASIFIPLTFITGVYGTNFDFIPELKLHWGYFMMWGVMLIMVIFMIIYFRRKKWF